VTVVGEIFEKKTGLKIMAKKEVFIRLERLHGT
jgi:hypothetical protein